MRLTDAHWSTFIFSFSVLPSPSEPAERQLLSFLKII